MEGSRDEVESLLASENIADQVRGIFCQNGVLSAVKGFEYRPQQERMAVAVAMALLEKRNLLVEGGTGVGKSLAYLVPAILYAKAEGKRAIVCTHTINLQEQLIGKDLPWLQKVFSQKLRLDFSYAMLKGRANYLCTRRLERARRNAKHLFTPGERDELERIYEWSLKTKDGSLSDLSWEPSSKVWQEVCSEQGICTPKSCGYNSDFAVDHKPCFYQQARGTVLTKDVLVLNHTLFFIYMGFSQEPPEDGVILKNDFVILDEGHTIENIAARHIGLNVSSTQYRYQLQRLYNPRTQKGILPSLFKLNQRESKSENNEDSIESLKVSAWGVGVKQEIVDVADALDAGMSFFDKIEQACNKLFKLGGQESKESKRKGRTEKGGLLQENWLEYRVREPDLLENTLSDHLKKLRKDIANLCEKSSVREGIEELQNYSVWLYNLELQVNDFLSQASPGYVYWVEREFSERGRLPQISIHSAPVDVSGYLRMRLFGADTSVIVTSATLSVCADGRKSFNQGLNYIVRRLGAQDSEQLQVGSPFDYNSQMKLYVAKQMPEPQDKLYEQELIQYIQKFVKMTHGKAFVLFTNNQLMKSTADEMDDFFREEGLDLYVQGTGLQRREMLQLFKKNRDSVLFGLDSFWQGVDVPGESLSNVIITRLPFMIPDQPLIEARLDTIRARNGNPFMEYSLPEAVLKFRQGIGRLIRSEQDKGIVVVLDNRIVGKRYGEVFLKAVPACPVELV